MQQQESLLTAQLSPAIRGHWPSKSPLSPPCRRIVAFWGPVMHSIPMRARCTRGRHVSRTLFFTSDISLARRRRRLYLADGLDAEDAEHTGALSAVQGVHPYAEHSLTVSRPRDISDAPQRSSTARGAICARVSKSWQGISLRLPALLTGIGVGWDACGTPLPSPPSPATSSTKSEST